jgi:hypothetical protein
MVFNSLPGITTSTKMNEQTISSTENSEADRESNSYFANRKDTASTTYPRFLN